jgi:hypothetical protein
MENVEAKRGPIMEEVSLMRSGTLLRGSLLPRVQAVHLLL